VRYIALVRRFGPVQAGPSKFKPTQLHHLAITVSKKNADPKSRTPQTPGPPAPRTPPTRLPFSLPNVTIIDRPRGPHARPGVIPGRCRSPRTWPLCVTGSRPLLQTNMRFTALHAPSAESSTPSPAIQTLFSNLRIILIKGIDYSVNIDFELL
jgi:hypothetical protein